MCSFTSLVVLFCKIQFSFLSARAVLTGGTAELKTDWVHGWQPCCFFFACMHALRSSQTDCIYWRWRYFSFLAAVQTRDCLPCVFASKKRMQVCSFNLHLHLMCLNAHPHTPPPRCIDPVRGCSQPWGFFWLFFFLSVNRAFHLYSLELFLSWCPNVHACENKLFVLAL